jgi:hypothetical protein
MADVLDVEGPGVRIDAIEDAPPCSPPPPNHRVTPPDRAG